MAVENGVASGQVEIAAAVVDQIQGERRARADGLAIEIAGVRTIGRVYPLVRMMMVDVVHGGAGMEDLELDVVAQVAVINVGGIIRVEGRGGAGRTVHGVSLGQRE